MEAIKLDREALNESRLELGGFIFLAAGLAPGRRRDDEIAVATEVQEVVKPVLADATEMQEIAIPVAEIAKPAATGTRAYYLAPLQREFPELAMQVASGELSVFASSKRISILRRSLREGWNASVPASARALSLAASLISRGSCGWVRSGSIAWPSGNRVA